MAEFIVNPRRAPRAPARCRALVASHGGAFEAETEDVGSRGCQIVSPAQVRKGEAVELVISNDKVADPLRVLGKVAWVSAQPPWRVGIAFEEPFVPSSARFFDKLVAAHPGMGSFRRVPERIPADATVYLGPPPRFLLDFTADEAKLLRAVGSGVRLDELQARLRAQWPAAQRALFSLLARQAVTLSRGQAAHPEAWKKVLIEVEAALAVESMDSVAPSLVAPPEPPRPAATPAPARPAATPAPLRPAATPVPGGVSPAASPWGAPVQNPHPMLELQDEGPSLEIEIQAPPPRGASRVDAAGWGGPQRDFEGAGVGWRKAPRERSAEAQAVFERALAEIEARNVNGAIALLRRAIALAPGDPEIAEALGKLAFKDRLPGGR